MSQVPAPMPLAVAMKVVQEASKASCETVELDRVSRYAAIDTWLMPLLSEVMAVVEHMYMTSVSYYGGEDSFVIHPPHPKRPMHVLLIGPDLFRFTDFNPGPGTSTMSIETIDGSFLAAAEPLDGSYAEIRTMIFRAIGSHDLAKSDPDIDRLCPSYGAPRML